MNTDRFSRQSFLGNRSEEQIKGIIVGVVGTGGGGSHIIQQLAHVGFAQYEIFDPDSVEHSNLNRMVGATLDDADKKRPKIEVAARVIKNLLPEANTNSHQIRWQEDPASLRRCHVIFGCLDGYSERRQL